MPCKIHIGTLSQLNLGAKKVAIIASNFIAPVVDSLVDGAIAGFTKVGLKEDNIDVFRVPGSYEIPLIAKHVLSSDKYLGAVALGVVMKGDTTHDLHVTSACTSGINQVSLEVGKPISFGIINTNNLDDAMNRAGGKNGNRGYDYALSLIEMLNLIDDIKGNVL